MNTISQKKINPRLLAVMLFLSIISPAFGQELIRENDNYTLCDTSIVRETSKDTVLIYNRRSTSTFMLVTPDNLYKSTIYIEPVYVNDFEVLNKTVYFCGYRVNEGVKTAVYGHFYLTTFPNDDILYHDVPKCKELKKLDVYKTVEMQFLPEIHLVMTGTTDGTRSDVLMDMPMLSVVPTSGSMLISDDENENFDDVAVTEDYVVVSSRNKVQGIPVVNFWYYDRPSSLGMNIFASNPDKFRVSNPAVETPVFLEHTKANNFAAVYKVEGYSRITMLLMNVSNNLYNSFEIFVSNMGTNYPMDIKFNTRNGVYSILARMENSDDPDFVPPMRIFHVTSDDINGITLTALGTTYSEIYYHLWSLEALRETSDRFVVSGGAAYLPCLLRFNHYQDGTCLDKFNYRYGTGYILGYREEQEVSTTFLQVGMKEHSPRVVLPIPFPVVCGVQ